MKQEIVEEEEEDAPAASGKFFLFTLNTHRFSRLRIVPAGSGRSTRPVLDLGGGSARRSGELRAMHFARIRGIADGFVRFRRPDRQRSLSFDLDTKEVFSFDDRLTPFGTAAPGPRSRAAGPARPPANCKYSLLFVRTCPFRSDFVRLRVFPVGVPEAEHFAFQRQFGDDSVRPAAEEGRSGRSAAENLVAGETRGEQVGGFLGSFLPGTYFSVRVCSSSC